ncbi:MAG: FkbM family methyltransferase [Gemmataceae bacterium]
MHKVVNTLDYSVPASWKRFIKRLSPGLVAGFYRLLGRISSDRYEKITIQSGLLAGREFWCSLKRERPYFVGNYEHDVQDLMISLLKPGMVFYDIGGHNGFFSLLAANLVGQDGKVLTFEPNPSNVEIIKTNLGLNEDLATVIQVHPLAISKSSGTARFEGASRSSMGRIQSPSEPSSASVYEVQTISLDDFTASHPPPDVIKMDIEGGEVDALVGMDNLLKRKRPVVVVEIHNKEAHDALLQFLQRQSYRASQVGSKNPPTANPEWSEVDQYLAVPISKNNLL